MKSGGFSDIRSDESDMLGFSLIGFYVNIMSGVIELKSEPGKGTEFIVSIPQLAVDQKE